MWEKKNWSRLKRNEGKVELCALYWKGLMFSSFFGNEPTIRSLYWWNKIAALVNRRISDGITFLQSSDIQWNLSQINTQNLLAITNHCFINLPRQGVSKSNELCGVCEPSYGFWPMPFSLFHTILIGRISGRSFHKFSPTNDCIKFLINVQ